MPLARQETEAHFAGPSGQGGLLLVACGALARERAQYSMFFDHYSKVPQNVQDEVTKKVAG